MIDDRRARRAELNEKIDNATRVPMLALAVVYLGLVLVPQLMTMSEETLQTLATLEWMLWGVFAFELLLQTYLAPRRVKYLIDHWYDVVIVVFPFLRVLRVLRLLAVTARLWTEIRQLLRRRTAAVVSLVSLGAVGLSAVVIFIFERRADGPIDSLEDAFWWAAVTITTVGYGDTYPVTPAGRGIAVLLMIAGISLFGVITARVAAYFVEEEQEADDDVASKKLDAILERLSTLEQQNRELRAALRVDVREPETVE